MIKLKIFVLIFLYATVGYSSNLLSETQFKNFKNGYVMDYDKKTLCLVRNLKVYKDPKWVAKIDLKNGKKVFFSSPKSMFEFYHQPGKWFDIGVKSEDDFKNIIVTDYSTMELLEARKSFFVYGSRAISPGGDDLPAFKTRESAEHFASKYSGKRVMDFKSISPALIRLINGRI
jgi:nitrous oxide reductase accessory protein NosL